MNDQVDEVKQKVDIVSLIGEYIKVSKAGRNFKALCPFHSEKTPSFMISPELQMYKCFGCGESGDCFSFLEKYEGMEFGEALRFLAERVGVKLKSFQPEEGSEKDRLFEINNLALRFYQYLLLSHSVGKRALNYLTQERGLSLETIKTFQLGFSPETPYALPKYLIGKKKVHPEEIDRAGIGFFKGKDVIDRFRGRVIFPLFDHRGNVAGFAGRLLPGAREDLAKYINTPETPIYHKSKLLFGLNLVKQEIKKEGKAIVVEGELDMISSYQAGIKNVVAIKGSSLTEDQVGLMGRFTKEITLALDADFAGDTAARRGIVIAQKAGLEIKVARLTGAKDPDELARKDPEGYKKYLNEAVGVWDFILDFIFSKYDLASGEGKGQVSREAVPVLASIPDKIVQAHYTNYVAKKLGVSLEAVEEEIGRKEKEEEDKGEEKKIETTLQKPLEKSRHQLLEERFLTLAFQSDPKILTKKEIANLITTPLTKRIWESYQEYMKKHTSFSPSEFAEELPKELLNGYAEMALKDLEDLTSDPLLLKREINMVIRELKILELRHKIEAVGAKIREYEEGNDLKKLTEAQTKFSELTKTLSELEENKEGIIFTEE